MGIINQLDYETANLVAAGEVIDRPASIVKELIENAVDAGATRITLEIKKGGVTFIRVTDNGKGMAREDVPISIKRHATSKIKTGADLESIMTLGFRGEALASIAAVARLRIRTKRPEDEMGTELYSEPGVEPIVMEAGMSDGTTVIVEELFEKIPARRKFLKKDQTETNAVQAVFEKIALSNPQIAMTLMVDNAKRMQTVGNGRLDHTIYAVMGVEFASKIIEMEGSDASGRIKVHGYIGTPENVRSNRNYQCFFVNGRFVRSKCLMAALEQSYHSYIPEEKYPACVLFVEMPPTEVDVNVHPTKLEVKFADEKTMFETLFYTARGTLERRIPIPPLTVKKKSDPVNAFVPIEGKRDAEPRPVYNNQRNVKTGQMAYVDIAGNVKDEIPEAPPLPPQPPHRAAESVYEARVVEKPEDVPEKIIQTNYWEAIPPELDALMTARHNGKTIRPLPQQMVLGELPPEIEAIGPAPKRGGNHSSAFGPAEVPMPATQPEPAADVRQAVPAKKIAPPFRIIGEAFLSYVFVEVENRVMVIDKHAAHERILFENLRANRSTTAVARQMMLVSMAVTLTPEEMAALDDYDKDIKELGFEYTKRDAKTLEISAVPMGIEADMVADMIVTIADRLASGTGSAAISRDLVLDKALYQAACKAAIKAGRDEGIEHIKWIVKKILTLDDIKVCPHGRPVAFELTKSAIERQFKRS